MIFERNIEKQLKSWVKAEDRKPLLLMGARQTGKTTLLKDFGAKYFDNTAYFSFDETPELNHFFEQSKDVHRIINNLSLFHGGTIDAKNTLIIFDEIQESQAALNSLKYFCENAPQYKIIAAGSLLGITLGKTTSFPVGKVSFLNMHPLTFEEFLKNSNKKLYHIYLSIIQAETIETIPDLFFTQLLETFKQYFISGGMPEAAGYLIEKHSIEKTQITLKNILRAYELDFAKYTSPHEAVRINYIWKSIPSQLARENKKFLFKTIKTGARAREYETALLWLEQAGLLYRVYRTTKIHIPLKAYDDLAAFKIYLLDVGLLRHMVHLDPFSFINGNRLFVEFKGALTENYILQSLINQFDMMPRYWTSNGKAEIDFLVQYKGKIIPIEVKADTNIRSKSLAYYQNKYHPSIRLRFSVKNLQQNDNLINIPLFLADKTFELIDKFRF